MMLESGEDGDMVRPRKLVVVGFDPGGKGNNGIAILSDNDARCATVSDAREALQWIVQNVSEAPAAIGIDSLLHWSFVSWRPCDLWLRKRYPAVRNSVFHINSTYGSVAVQGVQFGIEARKVWPSVVLNETHPKVVRYATTGKAIDYDKLDLSMYGIDAKPDTEHAADALIAAAITRDALLRPSDFDDLVELSNDSNLPAGHVHYWWPKSRII